MVIEDPTKHPSNLMATLFIHESQRYTERYMASPGQALAYKIGSLKIQELRERAKTKLGAKFSLRDYHDQVLSDGALPLHLLEAKVDRWIAAQAPGKRH